MDPLHSPTFWLALGQIAAASMLLASDSAAVIALATRTMPPDRRRSAQRRGLLSAVALRILLCPLAAWLVVQPAAGLAAGLLLAWCALRLLVPERPGRVAPAGWRTSMLAADIATAGASAIAIAGAARGNPLLIALGLLVSLPLISLGGRLVLRVLPRYPVLLAAGAGLLAWIAGGLIARDALLARLPSPDTALLAAALPPVAALVVVALGAWLARRAAQRPGPLADLAPRDLQ